MENRKGGQLARPGIRRWLAVGGLLGLAACSNSQPPVLQGYIEGEYVYLSSPLAGALKTLSVRRGDTVEAGQPIFVLDPQPEAAQLQKAEQQRDQGQRLLQDLLKGKRPDEIAAIESQRDQARAGMDFSKVTRDRYQKLYPQHHIDRSTLDKAEATYESDRKRVQEIEFQLREAKRGARADVIKAQEAQVGAAIASVREAAWRLAEKSVVAPTGGLIFDTYYREGEFIPAGKAVASLLPPENIKVVFFVPETWRSRLKVNDRVTLHCDGCVQSYQAVIRFIAAEAEYTPPVIFSQASRSKLVYRVEAVPAPEALAQLHPGQPVEIRRLLGGGR